MTTATRRSDLRQMLVERQRELQDDVQNRIRGARVDQSHDVGDHVDTSDAHMQGEIEFAQLQMRALSRATRVRYSGCDRLVSDETVDVKWEQQKQPNSVMQSRRCPEGNTRG